MGLGKTIKKTYMKAKKKAYGSRGVKGRYYRVGAVQGLKNLAQDIEMIKGRLNVEKKYVDSDVISSRVGQCDVNNAGYLALDMTTSIAQGVGRTQRIGDSLKVTGMSIPIQFAGGAQMLSGRKLKLMFVRVRSADNGVTATETVDQIIDTNPLNGLRDYNSSLAYRNSKHDGISILRTKTYFLKGPQSDTGSAGVTNGEVPNLSVKFNLKLNDVWRYKTGSFPDGLKYYLIIMCDAGNRNGTTNSTLNVPVVVADSGVDCRVGQRIWFVDN